MPFFYINAQQLFFMLYTLNKTTKLKLHTSCYICTAMRFYRFCSWQDYCVRNILTVYSQLRCWPLNGLKKSSMSVRPSHKGMPDTQAIWVLGPS